MTPLQAITAYINYHLEPQHNGEGWADQVMIQAATNALHRPIDVNMFDLHGEHQVYHGGQHNGEHVVLHFTPQIQDHNDPLIVGNIANLHFVAHNEELMGLAAMFSSWHL